MFKNAITALIFAAPFVAAAPAAEPEALVKRCLVNAAEIDVWHEAGMSRYRAAFSSEGTEVSDFCKYFSNHGNDAQTACQFGSNIQCYHSDGVGSWVVDSSWTLGAPGDSSFYGCLSDSLETWIKRTGCATG